MGPDTAKLPVGIFYLPFQGKHDLDDCKGLARSINLGSGRPQGELEEEEPVLAPADYQGRKGGTGLGLHRTLRWR